MGYTNGLLEKIENRYDGENDAGPIQWATMDLVRVCQGQGRKIQELETQMTALQILVRDIAATVEELAEWKAEREAEAFLAESVAIWGSGEPHG